MEPRGHLHGNGLRQGLTRHTLKAAQDNSCKAVLLTPEQTRTLLMRTADRPAGHNALVGAGRINATAAVRAAVNPPEINTAPVANKGAKKHFAGGQIDRQADRCA